MECVLFLRVFPALTFLIAFPQARRHYNAMADVFQRDAKNVDFTYYLVHLVSLFPSLWPPALWI